MKPWAEMAEESHSGRGGVRLVQFLGSGLSVDFGVLILTNISMIRETLRKPEIEAADVLNAISKGCKVIRP